MEAISTLKEISQLVKKYNDLELMGKIVNLQTEVFGLSQENLELKRKLETSREKAEQREKLQLRRVGECNYYFMDGLKFTTNYGRQSSIIGNKNIWTLGLTYRFVVPIMPEGGRR